MPKTVYIETSVPSFYYETRTEPEMVARRDWTREWWDLHRHEYRLLTSEAVIEELEASAHPNKDLVLSLVDGIPVLPIEPQILEIVETYISRTLMPRRRSGDATHLAVASLHKCDFLLTWNCEHLANANKFGRIRRVNALLGLFIPELTTPYHLSARTHDTDADSTLGRIRRARHEFSARFDHDPEKATEFLMELQKRHEHLLYKPDEKSRKKPSRTGRAPARAGK